jgi:hypothetical protein
MSEGDEGSTEDKERRRQERIAAAVVTELVVAEKPHMAMLHDFSETGALVLTRTRLEAGEAIELRIHLGERLEETIVTRGSVVRVEPWAGGESFWPLAVAVHFEEPARGHEERLRKIAARQVELGIAPAKGG